MRWILVIALVVWIGCVIAWAHRYGARSYLKLGAALVVGALVVFIGFLVLGLVWWALGAFAAMLAVIALIFGVIYWADRRRVEAYEN